MARRCHPNENWSIAITNLQKPKCLLVALAGLLLWSFGALAEHYTIPLLVPAGTTSEPQGVLRILNTTDESGTVEIYAIDDAGSRSGPATFTLSASAAAEFTATDLASGNATLGLTGGIGSTVGDARLQIETDLDIVPLAFVRAVDGTLSAMHDTVRGAASDGSVGYTYNVPVFNPSTEMTQVSRLRLINPGDAAAAVTIGGRDDSGAEAVMGDVSLTLAAGGAKTLTAQQLEAGDTDLTGQLGAGTGKWRLTVSSDQPLEVVNIVASTAGYWNNLSTTAVAGAAPADEAGFNERFVGNSVIYDTSGARSTLEAADGNRFTDTVEADGVTETYMGSYSYRAIGPDAGLLTLDYDDGDACRANLYFSSRTSGWFASHCTGSDYPAEGSWLGGTWVVEADEDDGDGGVTETTYEVNDSLPGVPTSGFFVPARTGGGSEITASGAGTTIRLGTGGWFELNDGTRYTCMATGGCTVLNGTVTAGTVTGRAPGAGEVDRFPSFRTAAAPGNQTYTVGTAIATLTLPEATGGNGDLTYSLSPSVPGLTFNAAARQLSGTPSTAGTHAMTYTVTDEDGDTDTLGFTITVSAGTPTEGSLGECYVSLTVGIGQSCTYPGTTDAFSVNARGRGSFLTFLAGIRIRIDNQTINGRVYDLEASHQGDGVWRIDRIAGSTEVPDTPPMPGGGTMEPEDTSPSFAAGAGPGNQTYTVGTAIDTLTLPEASGGDGTLTYSLSPEVPGLSFNATTRQLTGSPSTAASYDMTYTATDEDADTDALSFTITVSGDDRASATQVEVGSDTRGTLTGGDVDYFRVDVTAAGTLEVYSSGGIDTVGRLEDATGSLIAENDDGGTNRNFRIAAEVSVGTYYVRVSGYSSGTTGSYTFHVRFPEFAPADQTAFNALVVGKRLASADPSYYTDFTSVGRFREVEPAATYMGSYTYEKTGANSGRVVFNYDDGDRCTTLVTFTSATTGTASYSCNDGSAGTSSWRLIDVPGPPDTTTYERLDLIQVSLGRVQFSFFSAGGCITLGNTTLNGVTYSIVSSKWQTRADSASAWSDIAGTERTGQLCSLNPTAPGQYRLVAEITISGTTGNYSSNILSI